MENNTQWNFYTAGAKNKKENKKKRDSFAVIGVEITEVLPKDVTLREWSTGVAD